MVNKTNKLFIAKIQDGNDKYSSMVSKVRKHRDYLISSHTAGELNTYVSFSPFPVFNDGYATEYSEDGKTESFVADESNGSKGPGTPGVRSIFNKAGAVVIGSSTGKMPPTDEIIYGEANEWRISNNVPLMDNVLNRRAIKRSSGCTVKELVEASSAGLLGRETYDYSDFMYCKYLGKISNNYLITLRRFPIPVDDYISTLGIDESTRRDPNISSQNSQSIGCMVSWMGTPGNEMNNILKYSISLPYKEQKAELQDVNAGADSQTGVANGLAAMFDPTYRQQYMKGQAGSAANTILGKFARVENGPYTDALTFKDANKVYGPVDAIKHTYMRSEDGLKFDQNITLVFDYELRSYNGINGRQAMLDLLSNILNVTYSTGTFWGGGYRGMGAHQNNFFNNMRIFKTTGGFTDFVDAFSQDLTDATKGFRDEMEAKHGGDWMSMLKSALNQLGGMLIAGSLNKLGRPAKAMANSLLSPAPVGFWHVTIGNPHHPIMSMGNMILKNTTIEHYGPLGLDDFPTGIKVTCELTRGKPRDIRDIEKLYMHGNDRIYTSMGPKVFEMYKHAKEYKEYKENGQNNNIQVMGDADAEITMGSGSSQLNIQIDDIGSLKYVLQKYFGHSDTTSIYVAAAEQENGSSKKKPAPKSNGTTQPKPEPDGVNNEGNEDVLNGRIAKIVTILNS